MDFFFASTILVIGLKAEEIRIVNQFKKLLSEFAVSYFRRSIVGKFADTHGTATVLKHILAIIEEINRGPEIHSLVTS